jgi:hypothetical protein
MSDIVEYQEKGTTIAVAQPQFLDAMRPAQKLAFATEMADALKPVLQAKGLIKHLNPRNPDDEYIELEGWQTVAALGGMACKIEWCRPVEDGFEARAVVVRTDTGIEVGAGESRCTRSESKWRQRDDYAISGMAQTRAQSRALRGVLAWVTVLAGFKPTPAEEMPDYEPAKPAQAAPVVQPPPKPAKASPAPKDGQETEPTLSREGKKELWNKIVECAANIPKSYVFSALGRATGGRILTLEGIKHGSNRDAQNCLTALQLAEEEFDAERTAAQDAHLVGNAKDGFIQDEIPL